MNVRDLIDPLRLYDGSKPAGRLEFVWGSFFYPFIVFILIGLAAELIATIIGGSNSTLFDVAGPIFAGAMLIAGFMIVLRRLKDLGKGAAYILIGIIPLINLVFLSWLVFTPGRSHRSQASDNSPHVHPAGQRSTSGRGIDQSSQVDACPSCGEPLPSGARFCPACGRPFG